MNDTGPKILDATFVAGATQMAALPAPAFAEVAFAGRSNVGKSSLINCLVARRKLVRTSSTPGCTRGIDIFRVRLPDAVLDLVDLPGYGYARRSKAERRSWGPLIERFLAERPGLRAVVVIVDIRRGPEDDDLDLVRLIEELGREVVVVATKVDKLSASKRKPALAALSRRCGRKVLAFSSTKGLGRQALWNAVLSVAAVGPQADQAST